MPKIKIINTLNIALDNFCNSETEFSNDGFIKDMELIADVFKQLQIDITILKDRIDILEKNRLEQSRITAERPKKKEVLKSD